MKFLCALFASLMAGAALLPAQEPTPAAPASAPVSDAEVAARETALTLAGAFANDGFRMRDGHWCEAISEGGKKSIEVNLYAGNQYWFSVGATPEAKEIKVKIFDETGAQANTESYAEGSTAAAGLRAESSGPYYVQIEETAGADATFCLVYSYK